jgi:uncharacterized protein YcfJ
MVGSSSLGAAGGALAGSLFGKGSGKLLSTAGGALIGAGTGAVIGSYFEQSNRNAAAIQYQNQHLRSMYQNSPAVVYQQRPHQSSIPLNCKINNNRVICGSE